MLRKTKLEEIEKFGVDKVQLSQGEGVGRCDVTGWANLPTCLSEDELSELGKVSNKNSASGRLELLLVVPLVYILILAYRFAA